MSIYMHGRACMQKAIQVCSVLSAALGYLLGSKEDLASGKKLKK